MSVPNSVQSSRRKKSPNNEEPSNNIPMNAFTADPLNLQQNSLAQPSFPRAPSNLIQDPNAFSAFTSDPLMMNQRPDSRPVPSRQTTNIKPQPTMANDPMNIYETPNPRPSPPRDTKTVNPPPPAPYLPPLLPQESGPIYQVPHLPPTVPRNPSNMNQFPMTMQAPIPREASNINSIPNPPRPTVSRGQANVPATPKPPSSLSRSRSRRNQVEDTPNRLLKDPSTVSASNIDYTKVLEGDADVHDETFYQVEIENEELLRKDYRTQLGSKQQCLTRRWQPTLIVVLALLALAGAIGGLAYWITLPKVITKPFLLYGEKCYMNSRSCDATRSLWCPNGICVCTGNYQWNSTAQNCSCGQYQTWNGIKCLNYGYFGDPCSSSSPCRPTLTCSATANQTFSTGQSICICDNTTYLDAVTTSSTYRTCINRLTYGNSCKTNFDCQNWLGLLCGGSSGSTTCKCGSTSYWNGSYCTRNAWGGEPCSSSVPCDTTRGLYCSNSTSLCVCDPTTFWDNVTAFSCQSIRSYGLNCQYDFQCNTTVNLSCPAIGTGCNCPSVSTGYICDCQAANFWDGQRCIARHSFNGTCPGQYACSANLVCHLGHCICPGNMLWNTTYCACPGSTQWNSTKNTCL